MPSQAIGFIYSHPIMTPLITLIPLLISISFELQSWNMLAFNVGQHDVIVYFYFIYFIFYLYLPNEYTSRHRGGPIQQHCIQYISSFC